MGLRSSTGVRGVGKAAPRVTNEAKRSRGACPATKVSPQRGAGREADAEPWPPQPSSQGRRARCWCPGVRTRPACSPEASKDKLASEGTSAAVLATAASQEKELLLPFRLQNHI